MLKRFQEILSSEAEAIQSIPVNTAIQSAIETILSSQGKLFISGIGKAGYVARKAASTFSTTGTPSVFLHPGDASHGDVGVIGSEDLLLAISNSGQTREVLETVHFCRHLGISGVIALTGNPESEIAKESDIILSIGQIKEPCPFELTPTASTAAMLALTDALALCIMEKRGFRREDFAARHHGGYLGKKSREE